jgi:type I restriction enzyme S subunit
VTGGAWPELRLKDVCQRSAEYGANIPSDAYVDGSDGVRFLRTTDITEDGRLQPAEAGVYVPAALARTATLEGGDLLVSRSGTIGRSLLYDADQHGPCSYAGYLVRFRPRENMDPRFIFYWTKSAGFVAQIAQDSIQTTIENFNGKKYAAMRLPAPSRDAQQRAADFLDRKTAAIDALIAKKERLIELLEEKRQALITQAVTKGLDPSVPMKDSGTEWLGPIPAHWRVARAKHAMARIVDCPHSTPHYVEEGEYPAIRTADMERGRLLLAKARRVDEDTYRDRVQRMVPLENDVLYSREGRFGMAALVPANVKLCLARE